MKFTTHALNPALARPRSLATRPLYTIQSRKVVFAIAAGKRDKRAEKNPLPLDIPKRKKVLLITNYAIG
jgi:hypothetical protein